jgi:hypothetical protein
MPSNLRQQVTVGSLAIQTISSTEQHPAKKQKMSISQTYRVASFARSKLGKEASKGDHDLRLLVGHANLLDSLMVELRDAERQQEAWFNQAVKKAQKEDATQRVRWVDTIAEEQEDDVFDDSESDSDSDSDFDEEEFAIAAAPLRRLRSPPVTITSHSMEEYDDQVFEDVEDSPELALTRTDSHPPELVDDSDSEGEDSSPPTTPPQASFQFGEMELDMAQLSAQKKKSSSKTPFVNSGIIIQANAVSLVEAF